jgi:SAM-dependent methyltransferase
MKYLWEQLATRLEATAYPDSARPELLGLMEGAPCRALELGCHRGALGAAMKARFPGLHHVGFEINAEAARDARSRIDDVVVADFLAHDTTSDPLFSQAFDAVVLADVLEHLYDPWATLVKLRRYLTLDGRVYVSVPNVRNWWLINELVQGRWPYQEAGLLDITHIRFFTLAECRRMFAETGYSVLKAAVTRDPRVTVGSGFSGISTLVTKDMALYNVDVAMAQELSALKFLFVLGISSNG